MTRKSLHLKRFAAISLVIVMCLSALAVLAPSASAAGEANNSTTILARATDHDAVWDYVPTEAGTTKVREWNGALISTQGKNIVTSTDGGITWQIMYAASANALGVYVHQDAIYYSTPGHIMRSTDGVQWTEVLQIGDNQYGIHWSWDAKGDRIIFGTYGSKSTETSVYLSSDNGLTWDRVFHIQGTTSEYHTHKVAIDPYDDGWIYVNIGDGRSYSGLYASEDWGNNWVHLPASGPRAGVGGEVHTTMNGFLACHFIDADRSIWYADNVPTGWMFDKKRMEMIKVVDMSDVMIDLGVPSSLEFWDFAEGRDLKYIVSRGYIEQKNHIYASADGVIWYLIQEVPYVTGPSISVVGDRLYYNGGGSWADVTLDTYLSSVATVWSIESMSMLRDVPIVWPVDDYYDVSISVGNATNMILNPSMEETDGTYVSHWYSSPGSLLDPPSFSPIARDGMYSLVIDEDWQNMEDYTYDYRVIEQDVDTYLEPGDYVLRFSVMTDIAISENVSMFPTWFLLIGDESHPFRHSAPMPGQWLDYVYYFSTDGGMMDEIRWFVRESGPTFHLDRVSVSQSPYYSISDQWDPPGSPLSVNDRQVEEGLIHIKAGDTIMLTKGYATVSFGEPDPAAIRNMQMSETLMMAVSAAMVVAVLGAVVGLLGKIKV